MATKELTIYNSNPFEKCGKIVSGERFVGRKSIISKIRERIVSGSANVSLVGLPRMGKSSIAYQALMENKDILAKSRIVPVFYTLTTSMDIPKFYDGLMRIIIRELKASQLVEDDVINTLCNFRNEYKISNEIYDVHDFIDTICQEKVRIIIILDEFDAASGIFKSSGGFEDLRTLCYEGERSNFVSFLTTSRRSIQNIETTCGNSTFYHLFAYGEIPISVFNEEDIELYWKRVRKHLKRNYSKKLSEEIISVLNAYSGSQPFLMDIVNSEMLPFLFTNAQSPLSEINIKLEEQFKYFERVINDEELLDFATEILLGPVVSENIQSEVDKLLRYGFIKETSAVYKKDILHADMGYMNSNGNVYTCISSDFTRYFYAAHRYDSRLLPIYGTLLKALKDMIEQYLKDNYGSSWEYNTESLNIQELRRMQDLDRQKHITQSPSLAYYINETVVKNIIRGDNVPFRGVFRNDFGRCIIKLNWVCDIRNHYAHSNSDFLSAEEIKKTQDYCEELLRYISDWRINQTSLQSATPV